VGRYVQLKKGGANFMGLCPFHEGKVAFLFGQPEQAVIFIALVVANMVYAIGFLMEHSGMSFVESVHDLAQQFGMQVPEDESSPQERERAALQRQKQVTLSDVLEKAGQCLPPAFEKFSSGRCLPQGSSALALAGGCWATTSPNTSTHLKPRYLARGHELYGLFEARTAIREAGYVLVTEGYMDVVALAQLVISPCRGHLGHSLHAGPCAQAVSLYRCGGVQLRWR